MEFCFFCVTYDRDYERFCAMVASFNKHNVENLPLIVALQDSRIYKDSSDFNAIVAKFKAFESENVRVILDSDFALNYLMREKSPLLDFKSGYINQEIAKLAFFESNLAEHYLCVDSDVIFIRDFGRNDFFDRRGVPYISLVEDKDLLCAPYYKAFGATRQQHLKRIFAIIERGEVDFNRVVRDFNISEFNDRIRTCHGMQILSAIVLSDFKQKFILPNALTYANLIEISPFEFSWYNAWFLKSKLLDSTPIEPLFKVYHTKEQFVLDKLSGQNLDGLKEQYLGVIFNSNWSGGMELRQFAKRRICDKILFKILKYIIPHI